MKKLYFFAIVFALALPGQLSAQADSVLLEEFRTYELREESLPEEVFIDGEFLAQYHLNPSKSGSQRIHIWSKPSHPDSIFDLRDIRYRFNTHKEALDFHKRFLSINSEEGTLQNKPGIKIKGVDELKVFREGPGMERMLESFGLKIKYYYFLFVVDTYVVKIFVATGANVDIKTLEPIVQHAANRVKEYSK